VTVSGSRSCQSVRPASWRGADGLTDGPGGCQVHPGPTSRGVKETPMGVSSGGPVGTDPHQRRPDSSEDEPSQSARIMMEKMEVRVPASHTDALLGSATSALFAVGAVVSPAVTLRAVPGDLPTWVVAGAISGQLLVLA